MEGRRINEVRIALRRGIVVIPWLSREALLKQLRTWDALADVREIFLAVGTTRPVRLTDPQKAGLMNVITLWANRLEDGYDELPPGINDLRHALHDDVHGVSIEDDDGVDA